MEEEHRLRVLVAEDSETNQQVFLRVLQRLGCEAEAVSNGKEAIEALARKEFDVVLMDVQMPVMDGLAATREIRRRWGGRLNPRVFALTGTSLPEEREKCLSAGMDGVVGKPLDLRALARLLADCQAPKRTATAQQQANAPPSAAEALDLERLDRLEADLGDRGAMMQVIESYLGEAPKHISDLRQAVAKGDAQALHHVAHTLKTISSAIGATDLGQRCDALEELGRAGRVSGAVEGVARVRAEYERVRSALEDVRRQQA